jgi:hypothetical protein
MSFLVCNFKELVFAIKLSVEKFAAGDPLKLSWNSKVCGKAVSEMRNLKTTKTVGLL